MLQIEIDSGSGFCFGVTTAIQKAEEELAKGNILYCLGDIVHNGMECDRLRQMGLITIDHEEMERLHHVKVLLRAHGEPPETYVLAQKNNIEIIDATCPVVLQLQKRIKKQYELSRHSAPSTPHSATISPHSAPISPHSAPIPPHSAPIPQHSAPIPSHSAPIPSHSALEQESALSSSSGMSRFHRDCPSPSQIVIFGKKGHAEVLGLVGQTQSTAIVIESFSEVTKLDFTRDIYLYSQTTKSLDEFHRIIDYIQSHIAAGATFKSFDTICRSVANRMPCISQFATRHDLILFVCGRKSSNGKVLFNECLRVNANTHLIEGPEEISQDWLQGIQTIGICGATSTPKWLMEKCRDAILQQLP